MSGRGLDPKDVVEPVPTTTPLSFAPLPTPKFRAGLVRFGKATIPPACVHEYARVAVKFPVTLRPVAMPPGEMKFPCAAESPESKPMSTMLYIGCALAGLHAVQNVASTAIVRSLMRTVMLLLVSSHSGRSRGLKYATSLLYAQFHQLRQFRVILRFARFCAKTVHGRSSLTDESPPLDLLDRDERSRHDRRHRSRRIHRIQPRSSAR